MKNNSAAIRAAVESSDMTYRECAKYLGVAPRTLQDWAYGKRNPRKGNVAEMISALSILTKEGREDLAETGDWETAIQQLKIEQARSKSKIGAFGETFSASLRRVPESCFEVLSAEALAELIDALHTAFQDGKKGE